MTARDEPAGHEAACARVAALFPQRWLREYVRRKLRSDPVFQLGFQTLCDSTLPIMDIGCGVGLLAFYLRERGLEVPIFGLDIDARKVRQANSVASGRYSGVAFDVNDVRESLPAFSGNVVLFDVLHYLPPGAQQALLREVRERVAPGGMILIRDGVRDGSARYWATLIGEKLAQAVSWNVGAPLHFASRDEITGAFLAGAFSGEELPASGNMPLNNYLFVFRRRR